MTLRQGLALGLATGGVLLAVHHQMGLALALVLLAFAAGHDLVARTIPDEVSVLVLAIGLLLRLQQGGWPLALSVGVGTAVFLLCLLAWRFGGLGGGDVKLITASSVLVPAPEVPALLAAIALAGGVLALGYILARRLVPVPAAAGTRPRHLVARAWRAERRRIRRGGPLPYAVAIALGSAWVAAGQGIVP